MRRATTGSRDPSTSDIGKPGAGAAALAANIGAFLVTLNVSMVTVALPEIGGQQGAGFDAVQWVLSGYSLVFAALLLSARAEPSRPGSRSSRSARWPAPPRRALAS